MNVLLTVSSRGEAPWLSPMRSVIDAGGAAFAARSRRAPSPGAPCSRIDGCRRSEHPGRNRSSACVRRCSPERPLADEPDWAADLSRGRVAGAKRRERAAAARVALRAAELWRRFLVGAAGGGARRCPRTGRRDRCGGGDRGECQTLVHGIPPWGVMTADPTAIGDSHGMSGRAARHCRAASVHGDGGQRGRSVDPLLSRSVPGDAGGAPDRHGSR